MRPCRLNKRQLFVYEYNRPDDDDGEVENVPGAAQVRVRVKHEAVGDDLDDRLERKNH